MPNNCVLPRRITPASRVRFLLVGLVLISGALGLYLLIPGFGMDSDAPHIRFYTKLILACSLLGACSGLFLLVKSMVPSRCPHCQGKLRWLQCRIPVNEQDKLLHVLQAWSDPEWVCCLGGALAGGEYLVCSLFYCTQCQDRGHLEIREAQNGRTMVHRRLIQGSGPMASLLALFEGPQANPSSPGP